MKLRSSLYVGSVFHRRFSPKAHYFRYRLFWLLVDLDELPKINRLFWLLSHNRPNVFSVFDRDHGDRGGAPLRAQTEKLLAENGVAFDGGSILMLSMPRALGVGFNPLSVYWCYRRDGVLAAMVYQVHNTFGERHAYVEPVTPGASGVRQGCDKAFFVSPFLPMGLRYEFHVSQPDESLAVAIRVYGPDGVALHAALAGRRRDLSDRALLAVGLRIPAVALKTLAAIHWEAARLWLKGVPYLGRSRPLLAAVGKSPAGPSRSG